MAAPNGKHTQTILEELTSKNTKPNMYEEIDIDTGWSRIIQNMQQAIQHASPPNSKTTALARKRHISHRKGDTDTEVEVFRRSLWMEVFNKMVDEDEQRHLMGALEQTQEQDRRQKQVQLATAVRTITSKLSRYITDQPKQFGRSRTSQNK